MNRQKRNVLSTGIGGALALTVATVFAVSTSLTGAGVASPSSGTTYAGFESPISVSSASFGEKITEFSENIEYTPEETTADLLDAAEVTNSTPTESGQPLDVEASYGMETQNGSYILHVPFQSSSALLDISGYTVMFNPDRTVAGRGEVVYEERSENSGRVALWQDGALITDQVITAPASDVSGSNTEAAFNWDKLNKCLLNAGIAQWAVTAVGVACALLCAGTAGLGCVACVVATAGVIGTTAGTCVAQAMVS